MQTDIYCISFIFRQCIQPTLIFLSEGKHVLKSLCFSGTERLCRCAKRGRWNQKGCHQLSDLQFFHGFRSHFQIVRWKLLDDVESNLKPEDWGWSIKENTMTPIKSDLLVAPERLLKIIRCNCKDSSKAPCSTAICSCRKHGLTCASSCGDCHGELCEF